MLSLCCAARGQHRADLINRTIGRTYRRIKSIHRAFRRGAYKGARQFYVRWISLSPFLSSSTTRDFSAGTRAFFFFFFPNTSLYLDQISGRMSAYNFFSHFFCARAEVAKSNSESSDKNESLFFFSTFACSPKLFISRKLCYKRSAFEYFSALAKPNRSTRNLSGGICAPIKIQFGRWRNARGGRVYNTAVVFGRISRKARDIASGYRYRAGPRISRFSANTRNILEPSGKRGKEGGWEGEDSLDGAKNRKKTARRVAARAVPCIVETETEMRAA